MVRRKKTKIETSGSQSIAAPFSGLAGLRDDLPPGESVEDVVADSTLEPATFAAKVVLSHQRKGHGGKTVTLLSGVLLRNGARAEFMRELGRALGTNVRVEADNIIMAGDQRERAKSWLKARGAKRVVTSG